MLDLHQIELVAAAHEVDDIGDGHDPAEMARSCINDRQSAEPFTSHDSTAWMIGVVRWAVTTFLVAIVMISPS